MKIKKIAWKKERYEEISCDFQDRLDSRNREVQEVIENLKTQGTESLKQKIEETKRKGLASVQNRIYATQQRINLLRQKVASIQMSILQLETSLPIERQNEVNSLKAKLESIKQQGLENLRKRIATIRSNHEAALARMRQNYEQQVEKLGFIPNPVAQEGR